MASSMPASAYERSIVSVRLAVPGGRSFSDCVSYDGSVGAAFTDLQTSTSRCTERKNVPAGAQENDVDGNDPRSSVTVDVDGNDPRSSVTVTGAFFPAGMSID